MMAQAEGSVGGGVLNGDVSNLQGWSVGVGGDIGTPAGMIGGSASVSGTSVGALKGHGGTGAGLSLGIDVCHTFIDGLGSDIY